MDEEWKDKLRESYRNTGYRVLFTSARQGEGLEELCQILTGKTTTVAGPSGVGKSSLINRLQTGISMETSEISTKIERGKHTTRHSELIYVSEDTYIVDTPGFSSIELYGMEKEELQDYFPEFADWEPECRFAGCEMCIRDRHIVSVCSRKCLQTLLIILSRHGCIRKLRTAVT